MRNAFLLSALALALGLGWFLLRAEPYPHSPLNRAISLEEAPTPPGLEAPLGFAAPKAEAAALLEPSTDQGVGQRPLGVPGIRWDELEILGRLVSVEGVPLPHYTVLVAPSGLKPAAAGVLPLAQRCVTDARGDCAFRGLSQPGPWDVYAFPMDLDSERRSLERNARVGTVTAKNPGDANRVTFTVATGAVVVLRSPLPDGVAAGDLWFEALPTAARGGRKRPTHRFTQGALSEEGDVTALLPAEKTPPQSRGFAVHVRTLDGLHGLVATRDEGLAQQKEIVVSESLERRGRVAVRLVIRDVRQVSSNDVVMDDGDWHRAIQAVDWRLLMDDKSRSGPDLPGGLRTTSEHRAWARTGTDTFELTDLPLGVPVEIGAVGAASAGAEAFLPEALLRMNPAHGDVEPLDVRIRRVDE